MSAKAILICIGLWYALKTIFLTMVGGVSMASVEGVADVDEWRRSIVAAISPAFVYMFGAIVYGLTAIQSKDATAIEVGIQRTFHWHLGWFALCLFHFFLDPLLPSRLSFHNGPAATTMRYLGVALPYFLMSVLIFVWVRRIAEPTDPCQHPE